MLHPPTPSFFVKRLLDTQIAGNLLLANYDDLAVLVR